MNDLQKVLVVDDGDRSEERSLSSDLAELGFSSVTTSLDATDDVLQVIARPSAIFLQMPSPQDERRWEFQALAERLRTGQSDVPVFVVNGALSGEADELSTILGRQCGTQLLAAPVAS